MSFKRKLIELGVEGASKLGLFRSFRFFYRASGYTEEELKRPLILVANTYMESTLGHSHLDRIAEAVRAGVYLGGGTPVVFNTIGPCGGYAREKAFTTKAMHSDLPQREAIADTVEIQVRNINPDALVCIGTCDKSIPGLLLAAARLNLPTIFVTGGPALPGEAGGRETVFPSEIVGIASEKVREGEKGIIEARRFISSCESCWVRTPGACPEMTTANTMQIATEVMGLCLPGSSTCPAVWNEKIAQAKLSGMLAVKLASKKKRFSHFVTESAVLDAVKVIGSLAGGTNGILHLLTLAREMDLNITLDDIADALSSVPLIGAFRPSGPHTIFDLHIAGGVPAVLRELQALLDLERECVTGEKLSKIAEKAQKKGDALKSLSSPHAPRSAIYVLKGNLAPHGALARPTVEGALTKFRGKAKCFDSQDEAISALLAGEIKEGDALVLRYQGPRGGPGFVENFQVVLLSGFLGIKKVAVISDGRFSGATTGCLYVGYVSPEAQARGPIAAVQDGDEIEIDVEKGTINLLLSEEEIKRRLAYFVPKPPPEEKGVLQDWYFNASQFHEGATLLRRRRG